MNWTAYFFNNPFTKWIKWLWLSFIIGILSFVFLLWMVSLGWFGELPPLEELENPKTYLASEIFSEDGVMIGKYYLQNRSNANFVDISPNLINALIATEDVRFYDHSGIDFRRVFTAILFVGTRGGASTVTQQLAKNLTMYLIRQLQNLKNGLQLLELKNVIPKKK